ncbi:thioredoxin family protein [Wolffia australiana]
MGGGVDEIRSKAELDEAIRGGDLLVLHFWAAWCDASKQMDQVFAHLAADFPSVRFFRVEAEEQPEISETFSVSAVPYFVFFKGSKVVDSLEGASPPSLAEKLSKLAGTNGQKSNPEVRVEDQTHPRVDWGPELTPEKPPQSASSSLNSRLEELINRGPVMLFMKGTPEEPRCGFSRKAVEILRQEKVDFQSFDILIDDEVRQGLKVFSNWSSYPQLYIKGELIGGSDIMLEMQRTGELEKTLVEKGVDRGGEPAEERLRNLITSSPVMLFMKGSPDTPRCGFSSKVVGALRGEGVDFGHFDILEDEEVRQGLKTLSNWPTYPQLYYKGELIGGCDIILELHRSGELKATLSE